MHDNSVVRLFVFTPVKHDDNSRIDDFFYSLKYMSGNP